MSIVTEHIKIMEEVPQVYFHITEGLITDPLLDAQKVIDATEAHYKGLYHLIFREFLESFRSDIDKDSFNLIVNEIEDYF